MAPIATNVPATNTAAYGLLFTIETVLREFIIESLESVAGPRWYIQRLPGDILTKYKTSIGEARRVRWIHLVPHHPVYYLDFPDLRKIVDRTDNWNDAFKQTIQKKNLFLALLEELEPIRNTVAHNRSTSPSALSVAEDAANKLKQYIGNERFDRFASRCTSRKDIPTQLKQLIAEAAICLDRCLRYDRLGDLPLWNVIRDEWWFDESYLGIGLHSVVGYYNLLREYSTLPHARGTGPAIEAWMKQHDLTSAFQSAQGVLTNYLSVVS